eukprot:SAG31_NODE_1999_length_6695_cov_2.926774_6_plen_285_part_00
MSTDMGSEGEAIHSLEIRGEFTRARFEFTRAHPWSLQWPSLGTKAIAMVEPASMMTIGDYKYIDMAAGKCGGQARIPFAAPCPIQLAHRLKWLDLATLHDQAEWRLRHVNEILDSSAELLENPGVFCKRAEDVQDRLKQLARSGDPRLTFANLSTSGVRRELDTRLAAAELALRDGKRVAWKDVHESIKLQGMAMLDKVDKLNAELRIITGMVCPRVFVCARVWLSMCGCQCFSRLSIVGELSDRICEQRCRTRRVVADSSCHCEWWSGRASDKGDRRATLVRV